MEKYSKVDIFWEGHKIWRNLHHIFDWHSIGQTYGGDFSKFCGLLRIYELYLVRKGYAKVICLSVKYKKHSRVGKKNVKIHGL